MKSECMYGVRYKILCTPYLSLADGVDRIGMDVAVVVVEVVDDGGRRTWAWMGWADGREREHEHP